MKKILFSLTVIFLITAAPLWAAQKLEFDPSNSTIKGSIKYAVIGRYRADFEQYQGYVTYDKEKKMITFVWLDIDAATITSSSENLDKVVRSKKILDVKKYPKITFNGTTIEEAEKGYIVKGMLNMHGMKRKLNFPFEMEELEFDDGERILRASGKWNVKRKIFGIIWNKYLDKGGIVVGNYITINWEIDFKL